MGTVKKIELAIQEVKTNPKYKKNRIGLLKLLEARLINVITSEELISLNEKHLIEWSEK